MTGFTERRYSFRCACGLSWRELRHDLTEAVACKCGETEKIDVLSIILESQMDNTEKQPELFRKLTELEKHWMDLSQRTDSFSMELRANLAKSNPEYRKFDPAMAELQAIEAVAEQITEITTPKKPKMIFTPEEPEDEFDKWIRTH